MLNFSVAAPKYNHSITFSSLKFFFSADSLMVSPVLLREFPAFWQSQPTKNNVQLPAENIYLSYIK
ncbi:MAG: hypothetical protein BRC41_07460 [Cyanobacteria bacterium QH_9_48_43]|nr:MAG: hypothetical protein BRC37_15105 [Cyanobacteria bacterium QH_3_48_40]PSO80178.1 MAG: hypothetical protein BRC44_07020 [Cyanobacteria bacterium QS_4_48_99]PSO86034.1 MAG: hypothetical protein BRC41_07460 [Cyanobacteria bacterium QH_9_48_43]PSP20397.1 MAG: hypothetical protein BRC52_08680 [Cyanobacteria bacterium SW_5_48_44]